MSMKLERITSRYAIEIEANSFLALLDSESYVTDSAAFKAGNQMLSEKLEKQTAAMRVEYNGHFGNYVYLDLNEEDNNEATHALITGIIEEHLTWCGSLPIQEHVKKRRAG